MEKNCPSDEFIVGSLLRRKDKIAANKGSIPRSIAEESSRNRVDAKIPNLSTKTLAMVDGGEGGDEDDDGDDDDDDDLLPYLSFGSSNEYPYGHSQTGLLLVSNKAVEMSNNKVFEQIQSFDATFQELHEQVGVRFDKGEMEKRREIRVGK
ncbi:hypothetical protein LguiB_001578 [Lonicera macranthoides]